MKSNYDLNWPRPRLWQAALLIACVACAPVEREEAVGGDQGGPPQVYAVNYPLAYFAERIAGDSVQVVFPAPADVDPATWSPGIDAVAAFQQADLVLLNGAGYAGWVQRVTLSESRLVDTSGEDLRARDGASMSTEDLKEVGLSAREIRELRTKLQPREVPDYELDLSTMRHADDVAAEMYEAVPTPPE